MEFKLQATKVEFRVRFVGRVVCLSVCASVCPMVTTVTSGKTADSIEMPFGVMGRVGPGTMYLIRGVM